MGAGEGKVTLCAEAKASELLAEASAALLALETMRTARKTEA